MGVEFTFIDDHKVTAREREQERAKALSHAAKFTHRLRRARQHSLQLATQAASETVLTSRSSSVLPERSDVPYAPKSLETTCEILSPRNWQSRMNVVKSLGIQLSPQSSQVFHFVACAYATDSMFLQDGRSVQPWATNHASEYMSRSVIYGSRNAILQAAEELPYSLMAERATGQNELHRHSLNCMALVVKATQALLRDKSSSTFTKDLIPLVSKLFSAAVTMSHLQRARLHGKLLQGLLLKTLHDTGPCSVDIMMLAYVVQHDYQIASATASHTIFDIQFWKVRCINSRLEPVFSLLRLPFGFYSRRLSLIPLSPFLDGIRSRIHMWVWLWCHHNRHKVLDPLNDITAVLAYYALEQGMFSAELNNHFVLLRESILRTRASGDMDLSLHTEIVSTLGLLAYLATFMGNPQFNGVYVWAKASCFLTQLRRFLPRLIDHTLASLDGGPPGELLESEDSRRHHAILFSCWVGATWEQRSEIFLRSSERWFEPRFARIAQQLGLTCWAEVQARLNRVCISDYARPSGASWVNRVVG